VNVSLNPKAFDCKQCQWGRHCDDSNPATHNRFKLTLGKETIYEARVCPKPIVLDDEFSLQMLADHVHYRNRVLPFGGGTYEQPHIFMQAMSVIEQVYSEYGKRPRSED